MASREPESVGNFRGEDKSEEQIRLNSEALRRAQGDFPAIGSDVTPQSSVISDRRAPVPVNDATLNFGSTDVLTSGWIPEIPYSDSLRQAAGGVGGERMTSSPPDHFGTKVTSVPDCTTSHTGKHMNSKDIFGS